MSEPGLHEARVHVRGDLQDAVLRLGFTQRVGHQEGILDGKKNQMVTNVCDRNTRVNLSLCCQ